MFIENDLTNIVTMVWDKELVVGVERNNGFDK
jgi:hypothetical protein